MVGGKESGLIAAKKTRKTAQDKLDVADTNYTTMFVGINAPTVGMVAQDIWVDSTSENFAVFRYLSGNWSTPVRGTIASSAINVAKADIKINGLLNGTVDSVGLHTLMKNADVLAREISVLYALFDQYGADGSVIENTFSAAMGDMLRDGYWNDSNYIVGQESKLYADAQEIMRIMAQPDSTYSVKFVELSEAAISAPELTGISAVATIESEIVDGKAIINVPEPIAGISFPFQSIPNDGDLMSVQTGDAMHVTFSLDSGYLFVDPRGWMTESYVIPSWKDIDLDFSVHIIDEEIGISVWGFVDKVIKCYDKPWQTTISVSTKESDIGSKTFTDILSSIASIAEEVRGKSDVYDRSRLISNAKTISAAALQGIIDVNRTKILATASNWGTDAQGNIVFTAQDNSAAMM